jgi:peptidyl-prolyl cis-trans isomerase C
MRLLAASLATLLLSSLVMTACPQGASTTARSNQPGEKPAPESGPAVARIGDTVITVSALERRIAEQSPFVRARYADPVQKRELLDQQVRFEVLANEAFARGYQNDPEVQDALKKLVVQKLTREEFDARVKLADITDAEIAAYYEAHRAEYEKPEMMRGSHIFIAFGDDKAAAKKRADAARKRAEDDGKRDDKNGFRVLAAELSEDETTKRAGGDLRYMTADEVAGQLGPAVKTWLFASKTEGELSPVLEGKAGFHVVKRTGAREPMNRTLEQVKAQVKNLLFREKRTQAFNTLIDDLKKKQKVEIFEDKLQEVKVPAGVPPGDAAMPLGLDPQERDPHAHADAPAPGALTPGAAPTPEAAK